MEKDKSCLSEDVTVTVFRGYMTQPCYFLIPLGEDSALDMEVLGRLLPGNGLRHLQMTTSVSFVSLVCVS